MIKAITPLLDNIPGIRRWNFDLDDCDKILRVEGSGALGNTISLMLYESGYECTELE